MENSESGLSAFATACFISIFGALLALLLGIMFAGNAAFDAALHGAPHGQILSQVSRELTRPMALLSLLGLALAGSALAGAVQTRWTQIFVVARFAAVGGLTAAAMLAVLLILPAAMPAWVFLLAVALPVPFTFAGGAIGRMKPSNNGNETLRGPGEEPQIRRTVEHVVRDREFVEQYALVASQRKQQLALEEDRRARLDEQRALERARAESTARMRAIARAAFMSHPAATTFDFERCWPEIRDQLFKQHTVQLLTESVQQVDELTEEIERTSTRTLLRLAAASPSSQEPAMARTLNLVGNGEMQDPEGEQSVDRQRALSVIAAARDGNVNRLKAMIEARANLNVKNSEGWTPLMISVLKGHFEVARLLVLNGVPLEEKNNSGWTALRFAASIGDMEIIRLLVEQGADLNSTDDKGSTILMQAADEGNSNSVRALLDYGADREIRNASHDSALSIALRRGHADIVQMLKKGSAAGKKVVSRQ
jgi:hypothetical protein